MAAGGGGSWKVAYADFVTAMMALFLVLWITSQDQKIKEAIEHTFKHPWNPMQSGGIIPKTNTRLSAMNKEPGGGDAPTALEMEMLHRLNDDLLKVLQTTPELMQNNSIQIHFTDHGLNISVLDRLRKPIFEADTAQLTEYGGWVFSTLAWEIARYKNCRLEVEGHSAPSSKRDLWELTSDRANTARRYLVNHGVNSRQLAKVAGYADTIPMSHTSPSDEINNRVTLVLAVKNGETLQAAATHE